MKIKKAGLLCWCRFGCAELIAAAASMAAGVLCLRKLMGKTALATIYLYAGFDA